VVCAKRHAAGASTNIRLVVLRRATGRAFEHDRAFSIVTGEGSGAKELVSGELMVAFATAEVAQDCREEMVLFHRGVIEKWFGDSESLVGSEGHADGDGSVEVDDRRRV